MSERMPTRRPTILDLQEPGPVRSAAIAMAAGVLRMEVGVCGDRSYVLAQHVIDAAIAGATDGGR